ncbi:MAG: diadenylate cyclase CdaA [Rikenellaceae bacterium]|nr:diadenylate cyclase CdaA [Rikenellaceae bacterium]
MDFIDIKILDIIDIIVVAVLLYQLFRLIRRTNAISIFAGIITLYLTWLIVRLLGMELLSFILGQILGVGVIALIIVFQPEIRKFLFLIGDRYSRRKGPFLSRILFGKRYSASGGWIEEVVSACVDMSLTKTGALIVITRNNELNEYTEQGEQIDAVVKKSLLESIFFKNSPLHDGAVIIENGRIKAARCILPMSQETDIPVHFGTRHRAAVGLTEVSDAFVIIVSEERGQISIADNGVIVSNLNGDQLKNRLENAMSH